MPAGINVAVPICLSGGLFRSPHVCMSQLHSHAVKPYLSLGCVWVWVDTHARMHAQKLREADMCPAAILRHHSPAQ
jgi:hypothetical protein